MNYPNDLLTQLKARAGDRCECERSNCHGTLDRCDHRLADEPADAYAWSPVHTGEHLRFPPVASDYIALCKPCAVPRNARKA